MFELIDKDTAETLCGKDSVDAAGRIKPSFGYHDPLTDTVEYTAYLSLPEGGSIVAAWLVGADMLEAMWAMDEGVWPEPTGYRVWLPAV